MKVSIIVAAAENNAIGKDNQLICRLSADLKRFKSLTMGHHIIMGRKTYESIGRPLPGRRSVIISRNKDYKQEGCVVVHSLEEAFAICNDEEVFVIGGGEIYNQAFPLASNLYLTRMNSHIEGDTFIPEVKASEWNEVFREDLQKDEKNECDYSFINYERI
ncbi:MAG: dihydrofolate reductase [Marinifilaceae bacterium]